MTMLVVDGFDHQNPMTLKWDSVSGFNYTTGVFGTGKALGNTNSGSATKTLPSNYATLFQSDHFNTGNLSAVIIFQWMDAASNQVELRMDATGGLFFTRNGTAIGSTASTRLAANTVYWISAKVTIDPSAGEASVKV